MVALHKYLYIHVLISTSIPVIKFCMRLPLDKSKCVLVIFSLVLIVCITDIDLYSLTPISHTNNWCQTGWCHGNETSRLLTVQRENKKSIA